MSSIPLLPGIESHMVDTPRLRVHVRTSGPAEGTPVLFIHGNASSASFWEETMLALPADFRAIAPDLRGYGDTEDKLIDATRGMGDFVDDLLAVLDALGVERFHAVGHSLGGAVAFALMPAAGERMLSLTLAAPSSPFGFGGTRGLDGEPCWDDFAGSGGGTVNPEFVKRMAEGDRSADSPVSPRNVMNSFYWKPPFRPAREEELLSSLLSERVGPQQYPGDFAASGNWPGLAPGAYGPANALSPKYVGDTVERFLSAAYRPPVLWVRGVDDQIVGDASLFDFGMLGKIGAVPGWPGDDAFPPQPMVGQMRRVLERYAERGGSFRELALPDCGHTPYLEKPEEFNAAFHALLRGE